jgi:hypothetical protein
MEALREIFHSAGLADVAGRTIEVERKFPDFDAYWLGFVENPTPASAFIQQLPKDAHEDLRKAVRASLPAAPDGSITFAARANAVRGFAPG